MSLDNASATLAKDVLLYKLGAGLAMGRMNRNHKRLSEPDTEEFLEPYQKHFARLKSGIAQNDRFLAALCPAKGSMPTYDKGKPGQQARDATARLHILLQQFRREWTDAGAVERGPVFDFLRSSMPIQPGSRVLVPGSGLGRLCYDLAKDGHEVLGVDVSPVQHASLMALQALPEPMPMQPYILETCNRPCKDSGCEECLVPDVPLSSLGTPSFVLGDFPALYDTADEAGRWDGVVTSCFLDSGVEQTEAVRAIASCLKPGGVWANAGSLAYTYSSCDVDPPYATDVMLSWEELERFISAFFELGPVEWRDLPYGTAPWCLLQRPHKCAFFTATKR